MAANMIIFKKLGKLIFMIIVFIHDNSILECIHYYRYIFLYKMPAQSARQLCVGLHLSLQ